jgi:hypothetical protein
MKPFALKQHDKDSVEVRALRAEEITAVAGGEKPKKTNTITVTPSGASDDGSDAE